MTNQAAPSTRTEIIAQPPGVGVRIGQRNVAIRPDQVECRPPEADSPHPRLPGKKVEWQLKFGADFGQAAWWFAVDVDLPRQRGERAEVVFPRLGLDPGQAITAADGTGRTHWP